jgi:hypothetical protein
MSAPHNVLPPEVIKKLQAAARTQNTKADPMARTKAIDSVLAWARRQYPEYFK